LKTPIGLAALILTSTLLAACGGGSSSTPATPAAKISVSAVTTDQLVYRKTTIITITGLNLDLGFNILNTGCLKVTEVAGGTPSKRVFSCKMVGAGTVTMNITAGDASSLYAGTMTIPLAAQPQVTMVTSLGTIVLELNPAKAPITVDNFLNYVESNFYVSTIFHRVINGFMVQGGGFNASLQPLTTMPAIKLEVGNGLSNLRGSIAMARTSTLDSATSQFFVNVVDNASLDTSAGGYAVFGKVVAGLDIIDKIKVVQTSTQGGMADVPVTPITINSVIQSQ
jgi:peptidyl-prolyl cis-trans isomerase A (cyclophilin A)